MVLSDKSLAEFKSYLEVVYPSIEKIIERKKNSSSVEEFISKVHLLHFSDNPSGFVRDLTWIEKDEKCSTHVECRENMISTFVPHALEIRQENPDVPQEFLLPLSHIIRKSNSDYSESTSSDFVDRMTSQGVSKAINDTLLIYFVVRKFSGDKERAWDIAIEQLDQRLDPERRAVYMGAYLNNFDINPPLSTFNLTDHIQIRLTTFNDVSREALLADLFEGEVRRRTYLPPPYMVVVKNFGIKKTNIVFEAMVGSNSILIDNVVCALRLFRANYVGRDRVHTWISGLLPTGISGQADIDATASLFSGSIMLGEVNKPVYRLQEGELEDIKIIFDDLQSSTGREKLSVALRKFNDSYGRLDAKDQIIDLVIALENLFGEETVGQTTEVGYRLRLRAAKYLGDSSEERRALMAFLGDIYTLRSKIVHGDSKEVDALIKKKFKINIDEVVSRTEDLVRKAIRKMLRNPEHIGQKYQNEMLLDIFGVDRAESM